MVAGNPRFHPQQCSQSGLILAAYRSNATTERGRQYHRLLDPRDLASMSRALSGSAASDLA